MLFVLQQQRFQRPQQTVFEYRSRVLDNNFNLPGQVGQVMGSAGPRFWPNDTLAGESNSPARNGHKTLKKTRNLQLQSHQPFSRFPPIHPSLTRTSQMRLCEYAGKLAFRPPQPISTQEGVLPHMSKRTQRRAEQRRANRVNREQNGAASVQPASEAQIAANRENATHSTGPTSAIGKATVSQNRTVHGLNYNPNTFRVLACEDQAAYDDLFKQLTTEHKPTEITETLLVTSMAQHRWLLERANRLQETSFNQQTGEIADQKLFALYLRYATTHERAFHKCLADLLKLRSTKQKIEFGFESEKRRADRHNHFLDLKDLDFTYRQMKILDIEHERLLAEHPEIWPAKVKKAA